MNTFLKNRYTKLWPHLETSIKQLRYHAIPSLADKTPNRKTIHGSFNNVSNRNTTPEQIASGIVDISELLQICLITSISSVFYVNHHFIRFICHSLSNVFRLP